MNSLTTARDLVYLKEQQLDEVNLKGLGVEAKRRLQSAKSGLKTLGQNVRSVGEIGAGKLLDKYGQGVEERGMRTNTPFAAKAGRRISDYGKKLNTRGNTRTDWLNAKSDENYNQYKALRNRIGITKARENITRNYNLPSKEK